MLTNRERLLYLGNYDLCDRIFRGTAQVWRFIIYRYGEWRYFLRKKRVSQHRKIKVFPGAEPTVDVVKARPILTQGRVKHREPERATTLGIQDEKK